ncbi:MAG: ThiF family adenylyltransferase [candidate division NC10 bacterium]|nr:ThiF family adenylyltransferase [candidate division NC10 bacterium]
MDFRRQLDLVKEEALVTPIAVVGCGGIGTFTALALAKMGCRNLTLYDDDLVEGHNIPNQLYRVEDVGRAKVDALAEILKAFTGLSPDRRRERVDGQRLMGVVIAGIDSMKARKILWQKSIRYRASVPLYLDARMGAEVARLYTIRPADPDDVRFYERTLYDDAEAFEPPCTAASIIYNGFSIAALIASQVKKFLMGEGPRQEILFDLKTLTLTTTEG